MTITEFLLARIAEDEAEAQACVVEVGPTRAGELYEDGSGLAEADAFPSYPWGVGPSELAYMAGSGHPARVLAECEAKRQIIELHQRCNVHDHPGDECDACQRCGDGSIWPCDTLLAVASVYADHPDFDPAWRAADA